MVIEIYDLYDVVIKADGKTVEKNISGETVADALALSGIVLSEEDFSVPSVETALKDGMEIEVFRVTVKERTETEEMAYETETS